MYHVTSTRNRPSIEAHGLDWRRMGAAPGIAGSTEPEAEGVFVCAEFTVDFFVRLNNTDGPVDVWAVDNIDEDELIDNGTGFEYVARTVPRRELTLVRRGVPADREFAG